MLANEIDDYIQDLLARCDQLTHIALTGHRRIAKNDFSCYEVMRAHVMRPGGQFADELVIRRYFDSIAKGI